MKPELVFYNGVKLTEAPYWDKDSGILYFVAIRYNTIYSLNTRTLLVKSYVTDGPVGCALIDSDGNIFEAEKSGIYKINPKTNEKNFVNHINKNPKMRYNHGVFDLKGRFLVDIMGDEERSEGKGGLYSLHNGKATNLIYGTTVANGVCLTVDNTKLYFTDTVTKKVMSYDYDLENGTISNEKVVVQLSENDGKTDGLCLDIDGMLWVTEWDGSKICKWNPDTSEKLMEIPFPCRHVTGCCIGGENMEYLYVTTAKDVPEELGTGGGVFKIKLR